MKRLPVLIAILAVLIAPTIGGRPALASTPSSATISYSTPTRSWTGSGMTGSANSRRQVTCVAVPTACDNYTLTIDTTQSSVINHKAQIDISIVPSANASMNIMVYPPGCGTTTTPPDSCYSAYTTSAALVDPPNGVYTIQVACTACASASYSATATLSTRTIAVPPTCDGTTPCFPVSAATNLGPAGGEPSIQDDGAGNIYITTPVGTGSTLGTGVRFSRSNNGGQSWIKYGDVPYKNIGGDVGGSDSDVVVDVSRKNLYVADLAAADVSVLRSQDNGATFPQNAPAGPENDRQWVTTIGDKNVYLTYHDFALNTPVIFGSTDAGATFPPGLGFGGSGQIFGPTDTGFQDTKCNTLVGKPVTDKEGTLYILTNSSTLAEDGGAGCALPGPLDRFYMSVSTDGGHSFTSHLVSDLSAAGNPGQAISGSWGHVFNQLAIDNGGNLYIDASGTLDGSVPLQNYLLVSTDHGKTFSKPIRTNAQPAHGQLFPAIAAGQAGQVAVGYYQGAFPDHHLANSNFQFIIDQSFNALDAHPAFTHTQLTPLSGSTPQPNGICTDGLFCTVGVPPFSSGGNRNLADFESMTLSERGNLEVILPADSDGAKTENWFYRQVGGPQMVPGPTNGNGTGNQTYVAGARTTAPPGSVPATVVNPNLLPPTSRGLPAWISSGGAAGLAIVAGGALLRRRSAIRRRASH